MRIILLKDVRSVGQHNDVKEVADGYARNFLFPKKLAEPATLERLAELEQKRARRELQAKADEEQLDGKVNSLRGKTVAIAARATENGGLFKAVSAGDIAAAIRAEHSLEMPESAIHLNEPLKTLGEHIIELSGKAMKAEFGVIITSAA